MTARRSTGRLPMPSEPPRRTADRDVHATVLHRLIAGAPGGTTAEIQLLYDAVAPIAYRGTTVTPIARRARREKLAALAEADRVAAHDTPRGRVWAPLAMPEGLAVRHVATEPRESQAAGSGEHVEVGDDQ